RVVKAFYEARFSATLDSAAVNKVYDICKNGSGSVILPLKVKLTVSKGLLSLGESNFTKVKYEITYKKEKINNLLTNNCFDYDKISGSMVVRNRCEGDKIRLANRGVTKTLKKLFCELKIPEHLRGDLPVIADDKGVIWIYGVGISERVKIDSATENIVSISVKEIKE
ncbi:MAG: tRNA lysidine(34) synthetase TilS, partial [Clostridia bacterium]|nr:tRNA lysidine(34) synthetase TilS [Clostridia bacterium]